MPIGTEWRPALHRGACAFLVALLPAGACAQTVSLTVHVTGAGSHRVGDAVVVAVPTDGVIPASAHPRAEALDQIDKEFVPRVKPIFVGSTVSFPNKDNVRHHVYSFSPAKRFELPLYSGVPSQPVLFDKPGVVVLGCNIHDWMIGYIYVSESPYFAKTGADGSAVLGDLPPRTYVVRVWHPQLDGTEDATRQSIDVGSRDAEATFVVKLKPEVRVRRAPAGGHDSHY